MLMDSWTAEENQGGLGLYSSAHCTERRGFAASRRAAGGAQGPWRRRHRPASRGSLTSSTTARCVSVCRGRAARAHPRAESEWETRKKEGES